MNAYVRISKRLLRPVHGDYPTVERAEALVALAEAGDEQAYEQLFSINRFAPSPWTAEQAEALKIAVDGYRRLRPLFEARP